MNIKVTPFFLSGGICFEDIETIKQLNHVLLYGVDINSKFENELGEKDVNLIRQFTTQLRTNKRIN